MTLGSSPRRPAARLAPLAAVSLLPLLLLALLGASRLSPTGRAGAAADPPGPRAAAARGTSHRDVAAAPVLHAETPTRPGTSAYTVPLPDAARTLLLHAPPGASARDAPRPLVLVLPGLHLSAAGTELDSGADEAADHAGALVAYVDGVAGSWDAGTCCGVAAAAHLDDVDALHRIVASIATVTPVDLRRVVVGGFSNGAMMAYRMGCEHAREVAGLVIASGTLASAPCRPAAPVSIVAAHGWQDRTLPVAGQRSSSYLHQPTASVAATLAPFLAADGCRSTRTLDRGRWTVALHRSCRAGATVTVFLDARGGHRWPAPVPATTPRGQRSFSAAAFDLLAGSRSAVDFGRG